jgi:3-oxoacyl-ACP reductase-like protein
MSFFGKILEKLGLKSAKAEPAPAPAPKPAPTTAPAPAAPPPPPKPVAISVVDVVAKLEAMAAANPQKLNWKTSIVDLLKLLDIDSSFSARKELAVELGCPAELMGDSAKMNMWLHKTVLKQIAENGGNIPKELLD